MGIIEISDGVTNRRQQVQGFQGTIRVDLTDDGDPTVIVPETCALERSTTGDTPDGTVIGKN